MNKIDTASHALLSIINDILDYSKIEAGKLGIKCAPFELHHTVEQVVSLIILKAQEKGLVVAVDIRDNVPMHLSGDALRLQQILLNLISNAVKFTEDGSIELCIQRLEVAEDHTSDESGVWLEFGVKDSGIGMSEEQIKQIFQPFSQVDNSTTRLYGGTGLGLMICKDLVELMGGTIGVSSKPSQGSRFFFRVRLGVLPERNTYFAETNSVNTVSIFPFEKNIHGFHVLLVEDNVLNQEVAKELLVQDGLQVTTASNGIEALSFMESNSFDLIFMDIQMPEMDGYSTAKRIRQLQASVEGMKKDIPIIAVTAHALAGELEKCLAAGMNDLLTKPIDINRLRAMLDKWTPTTLAAKKYSLPDRDMVTAPSIGHIPYIDKSLFFKNVNYNERLYFSFLSSFKRNHLNTAFEIETAIRTGNFQSFLLLVHSVKGLAKVLAADELVILCSSLEQELEKGAEHIQPMLFRFKQILTDILSAIDEIDFTTNFTSILCSDKASLYEIKHLVEKLKVMLSSGHIDADIICQNLITKLSSYKHLYQYCAELYNAIDTFDYAKAIQIVTVINSTFDYDAPGDCGVTS